MTLAIVDAAAPSVTPPRPLLVLDNGENTAEATRQAGIATAAASSISNVSTAGSNIRIGSAALDAYEGTDAVGIGGLALYQATGIRNVGIGASAGGRITTGFGNIFLGWGAGSGLNQSQTVNSTIVIGYGAGSNSDGQIVLGTTDQDHLLMFGRSMARWNSAKTNLVLGDSGASPATWTGSVNLGAGVGVFAAATTASSNAAFGHYALESLTSGNGNAALGVAAGRLWQTVADSVAIGNAAGRAAVSGVGMTSVGYRSQEFASVARNQTSLGDSAFWISQGSRGVAIGYRSAEYNASGDDSIYIGTAAGVNRQNGDRNIFVGTSAGAINSASPSENPSTGVVTGTVAVGHRNLGFGHETLLENLGSDVVALGDRAGYSLTGASESVFIGSGAGNHGSQKVDAEGSIVIGHGAHCTRDNEIVIGKSTDTHVTLAGVTFTKAQLEALLALVA